MSSGRFPNDRAESEEYNDALVLDEDDILSEGDNEAGDDLQAIEESNERTTAGEERDTLTNAAGQHAGDADARIQPT